VKYFVWIHYKYIRYSVDQDSFCHLDPYEYVVKFHTSRNLNTGAPWVVVGSFLTLPIWGLTPKLWELHPASLEAWATAQEVQSYAMEAHTIALEAFP
jgi:hypothetical protein